MFGKPQDVDGECNSHFYIADDFGDNSATMRYQLPKGHEGAHREEFERCGGKVVVTWEKDEREAAEREEAYIEAIGELCRTTTGMWHSLGWGECLSCKYWEGDRRSNMGTCSLSNNSILDYNKCDQWSSCDPETAQKFRELDKKFGKDWHK